MFKKFAISSVLCSSFLFSSIPFASAESESLSVVSKDFSKAVVEYNGELVTVKFDNSEVYANATEDIIKDIVSQSNAGNNLIIYDISDGEESSLMDNTNASIDSAEVAPLGLIYSYSVTKKKDTIYNTPAAAQQVASVAYGETLTLSTSLTYTNSASIKGTLDADGVGELEGSLNSAVSYTYTKGRSLTGPAKGYSTRNYYFTKYVDHGDWEVTRKNNLTGGKTVFSGTYTEPTDATNKYSNWSQDYK
ncbi:hypothetical protein [Lysinibacillus sp. JNUCC 51]|uniref:hypothetical protein n=1 Tax=Lysinibacillus sp. JNUCC-51 TaxID=2792479 RepID=UPI0019353326|nr:hypothetical protein JNUCC51_13210 [Lysinibacillus sp. JNUCC-51]